MHTFIIVLAATFVICFCLKALKNSFGKYLALIIASFITILINCVYYAVNIDKFKITEDYVTFNIEDNVKIYSKNGEDIYIDSEEFGSKLRLDKVLNVFLSDRNQIQRIDYKYDFDNNWVFKEAFSVKDSDFNVYLKKDKYELLKSYQNAIEKRKKLLQKND